MKNYQAIYIECLNSAWAKRQQRNPAYSLRAFARDLEISPTGISLILNKKRPLTLERAINWAEKLQMNEDEKAVFLEAVSCDSVERLNPNNRKSEQLLEKIQYYELQLDQFAVVSDWYHLAILNLSMPWIASSA
jgi:transcriptional regulator with XRE-family HTH domain